MSYKIIITTDNNFEYISWTISSQLKQLQLEVPEQAPGWPSLPILRPSHELCRGHTSGPSSSSSWSSRSDLTQRLVVFLFLFMDPTLASLNDHWPFQFISWSPCLLQAFLFTSRICRSMAIIFCLLVSTLNLLNDPSIGHHILMKNV